MRIVDVGLLHNELEAANIPVASCSLPIFDPNTESTQYRASYIHYGDRYARIDWKSEPTTQQKMKAVELLAHHAKTQAAEFHTIIDVGSGFPEASQSQTKQPLKTVPSSTHFSPNEIYEVLQWALTKEIRLLTFSASPAFVQTSDDVLSRVEEVLRSQGVLEFFNGGAIFLGSYAIRTQVQTLAHWLLAQSLKFSPDEAVNRLHRFVELDATPVELVIGIRGINVKSEVDLGEGIKLLPFAQIPNSPTKQMLENPDQSSFSRPFSQGVPTSALVQAASIKPKMASDFLENPISNLDKQSLEKLRDTLHCLTLVGPCAPIALCEYYQTPEWIPLLYQGGGMSSPVHEIDPDVTIPDQVLPSLDVSEARKVIQGYLGLRKELKQKIHLPIERINRAMRRQSNVDKAIELRIALESILTADRDKDAPISFLIRLRGSLLLGGSPDERRRHFEFFRELYNLCSSAVHNGKLDDKVKKLKLPTTYVIQDGIELCANLIKRIIEQGHFPNWDDMALGIEL